MSDEAKREEILVLAMEIRNACQHPDADPRAILAAAQSSFTALRERWEAAAKPGG